jgi:hypothetical protein
MALSLTLPPLLFHTTVRVHPRNYLTTCQNSTNYGCSRSQTALHVNPPPSAPFYTGLKASCLYLRCFANPPLLKRSHGSSVIFCPDFSSSRPTETRPPTHRNSSIVFHVLSSPSLYTFTSALLRPAPNKKKQKFFLSPGSVAGARTCRLSIMAKDLSMTSRTGRDNQRKQGYSAMVVHRRLTVS